MRRYGPLLLTASLALAGASACQSRAQCELSLSALPGKKVPALLSYSSSHDTLAFVSGGQLTWHPLGTNSFAAIDSTGWQRQRGTLSLYGQLVRTSRTSYAHEVDILTTDGSNIPFFVGLYHRVIAPGPQALLRVRISSPNVVLTNTVRVGMTKADFIGLFFQHLTAEELHCLREYRVFTNDDPVGVYLNQTFLFRGDTLREILMQLPEMVRSEQKSAR